MLWRVAWLIVLLGLVSLGWYVELFDLLYAGIVRLANQPETADAFDDPGGGRVDALLMLVSFFLLTPVVLGAVLFVLVAVMIVFLLLTEPLLRTLSLPPWVCVTAVLVGAACAAYVARAVWVPQFVYVLGLAAKAGLVYFSSTPSVPR